MVDNSNMPHPKCLGSQKNPGTKPKTCEMGAKTKVPVFADIQIFALRAWHSHKNKNRKTASVEMQTKPVMTLN